MNCDKGIYYCEKLKNKIPEIDPNIIVISLALTALFISLIKDTTELIIKLFLLLLFLLSYISSQILYWTHISTRIPCTWDRLFTFKVNNKLIGKLFFSIFIWLIFYYPILLLRSIICPWKITLREQNIELAYLTLLAVFAISAFFSLIAVISKF